MAFLLHIIKAKDICEKALNESNKVKGGIGTVVIWFNLPYHESVKANIAKYLLMLIRKHFLKHHKLCMMFNKIAIRLSRGYTSNMKIFIK